MPSATYKPQAMTIERTQKAYEHITRTQHNGLVPDVYYYYLVDAMAEIERLRNELAKANKRVSDAGWKAEFDRARLEEAEARDPNRGWQ